MTSNITLVPTRNGEAPLLAAQRGRWADKLEEETNIPCITRKY